MLGNFSFFLSSAFFSKLTLSKNSFSNTIIVSNGLDPDRDRHSVSAGLGTFINGQQKLLLAKKVLKSKNQWKKE